MKPLIIRQVGNPEFHSQWDSDTILFESVEEAKEFIETFPSFFDRIEYELVPEELELSEIAHVFYKDLKNKESFKEELENRAN